MFALIAAVAIACPLEVEATEKASNLRVGHVLIAGNVRTPDGEILDELKFLRPGGSLPSEADVLRAEMKLLLTFHKRFDLTDRQRPKIEFEKDEVGSTFINVRIHFPEKRPKKK